MLVYENRMADVTLAKFKHHERQNTQIASLNARKH